MTFSHDETKIWIEFVLKWDASNVRLRLHNELSNAGRTEGEFYAGIVKHGHSMLTSDKWLELLTRLPNGLLRSQLDLERILSQEQLRKLPPALG